MQLLKLILLSGFIMVALVLICEWFVYGDDARCFSTECAK